MSNFRLYFENMDLLIWLHTNCKLIHCLHYFISGKTILRILDSIDVIRKHKNSVSMCSNHVKYSISFLKWALLHCAQPRLLLRDVGTGGARERSLPDYGISISHIPSKEGHIVRNAIWWKKNRASDNKGKFYSFLMCKI